MTPCSIDEQRQNAVPCATIQAINLIGGKWRLPILFYLSKLGTMRYSELKCHLPGTTNIMLTRALTDLEEGGLIYRKAYDQTPPKVEYWLTERGQGLLPALAMINEWGKELMAQSLSTQ